MHIMQQNEKTKRKETIEDNVNGGVYLEENSKRKICYLL